MQDQQVGDAFVLAEGQTEGRFGLAAGLSVAIHVPVYAIHIVVNVAIRDGVFCRGKRSLD